MNLKQSLALMFAAAMLLGECSSMRDSATDRSIEASARSSYVYRIYLKDDNIRIQAKDGTVTLAGSVAERSHRSLAEDTVESLPDVKHVDNRLAVRGGVDRSDGWIGTKVKTSLWFHRSVSSRTDVDVKDGLVMLTGIASRVRRKRT
jgi:hyperosmotically inducible periplasmic protein